MLEGGQQPSTAVGGVKDHGVPAVTVKLGAQVSTGGVVSTMLTVWLQVAKLVQQSMTCQVRVITVWQKVELALVIVPKTVMVTFVSQQASTAVGKSKVQPEPHSTFLLGEQVITGGLVSVIMTVSTHTAKFVQQSVACQVFVR
jgi:hypothetical protein